MPRCQHQKQPPQKLQLFPLRFQFYLQDTFCPTPRYHHQQLPFQSQYQKQLVQWLLKWPLQMWYPQDFSQLPRKVPPIFNRIINSNSFPKSYTTKTLLNISKTRSFQCLAGNCFSRQLAWKSRILPKWIWGLVQYWVLGTKRGRGSLVS